MDDWHRKGGSRGYVTTQRVNWPIGRKKSKHIVTIPKGFEFESSVPSFLRWFWSPDDPTFLLSACIHDWLLEAGYDSDFCDSQWLAAARKSRASPHRAKAARLAMMLRRYFFSDDRGINWGDVV
jgi:hypothetical protein